MALPLRTRLLLFLYSTRNIVGCLFALAGLGLFFAGQIDRGWLAIVAGLYLAGFLVVPKRTVLHEIDLAHVADDSLLDNLERLRRAARNALPDQARARLEDIQRTVAELLPRLRASAGTAGFEQVIAVTQAVGHDLPVTIDNYVRLPPAFAASYPLEGNKTARQLLSEQLDVLHKHLSDLLQSTLKDDAEAVVNNGLFLKEKFHRYDFVTGESG